MTEPIDVEQLLRDTVPGGSSCDPQQVADAIRGWFADRSPAPAEPVQQDTKEIKMQVTPEMVNRFLAWKLPRHFNPDGGVSFSTTRGDGMPPNTLRDYDRGDWPCGTNLFDAQQAREMLEHVLTTPHPVQPEEAVAREPSEFDVECVRNQLMPSVFALAAFDRILAALSRDAGGVNHG